MIEVEVLIPNFKDNENFNKEIEVTKNNKKIKVVNYLFQPGEKYFTTKERANYLIERKIVKLVKKEDKKESPKISD